MEHTIFAVTNLGKQDLILGYTWLEEHNPEIDWQTRKITMSRCPAKCHTCRAEIRDEQREAQRTKRYIWTCRAGPFPKLPEEESEEESGPREDVLEDVLRMCWRKEI